MNTIMLAIIYAVRMIFNSGDTEGTFKIINELPSSCRKEKILKND